MKARVLTKVAAQSILKNKMRTLLTMLGIVIGIASVIVMVAVGNGAQSQIESQIRSLGTNLIVVTPGATSIVWYQSGFSVTAAAAAGSTEPLAGASST